MSLDALNNDGLNRDGTAFDGSLQRRAGTGVQGGGLAVDIFSQLAGNKIQRNQIKSSADIEREALRKSQRAEFGSMIAQSAGSGIAGSSFQDLFNNQTIEDATQMAQLKQDEQNKIAQSKNQKRAGITKSVVGTASRVATLGASG